VKFCRVACTNLILFAARQFEPTQVEILRCGIILSSVLLCSLYVSLISDALRIFQRRGVDVVDLRY
jgi:hypothetical protein